MTIRLLAFMISPLHLQQSASLACPPAPRMRAMMTPTIEDDSFMFKLPKARMAVNPKRKDNSSKLIT